MLIALGKGLHAEIDDDDAVLVSGQAWRSRPKFRGSLDHYAYRTQWRNKTFYMHRVIAGAAPGEIIDHIDGNGLNNRRSNLRIASASQNCANRRGYAPKSGYRGVSAERGKYRAILYKENHCITIGTFSDPIEAARAYDRASLAAHGQFATLNFPNEV